MKRLAKLVQSATPSAGIQFRETEYGLAGAKEFLRDAIAIANAAVDGPRYIIVGAHIDDRGHKRLREVDSDDFTGNPSYLALANEYIEPPIRVRYQPVIVDGKRLGIYEIGDCQDRPYMMRIDHSETLRRGDAYTRANDRAVKMGRRQLQILFEEKFRDSVSADSIEIGFPGDIIRKEKQVGVCDLLELPSTVATAKLQQLIDIKSGIKARGSTTLVARLAHARLFGADDPYEERSVDDLAAEMRQVRQQYRDQDEHFLFDQRSQDLQLVVFNQGEEAIRDVALSLRVPNHAAFHVASCLPKVLEDDRFVDRTAAEQADYPSVSLSDDSIQVAVKIGDIPAGELIEAFTRRLRICAGNDLAGRRFGVQYSLFARNLRTPATGTLRLLF